MSPRTVKFGSTPHSFASLEAFLKRDATPAGNYDIEHGLPIQMYWAGRGSDTTFVAFNGAIGSTYTTVPAYAGFGTTQHLSANVLLLSDPSMVIDERLTLGWYAGNTRQPTLQADLTRIIRSFAGDTRVVLFGPSGGGYAALEQATRLPGSTAIVSNPQTDVTKYMPAAVERYLEIAWGMENFDGALPFAHQAVEAYAGPVDAQVVYVQNEGDLDHVQRHLQPFLEQLHPGNRVARLLPNLGEGHVGPDKESFMRLFDLVVCSPEWGALSNALDEFQVTRQG